MQDYIPKFPCTGWDYRIYYVKFWVLKSVLYSLNWHTVSTWWSLWAIELSRFLIWLLISQSFIFSTLSRCAIRSSTKLTFTSTSSPHLITSLIQASTRHQPQPISNFKSNLSIPSMNKPDEHLASTPPTLHPQPSISAILQSSLPSASSSNFQPQRPTTQQSSYFDNSNAFLPRTQTLSPAPSHATHKHITHNGRAKVNTLPRMAFFILSL